MITQPMQNLSLKELYNYFESPDHAERVPLVGVEYERLGLYRQTGEAIRFDGPASVQTVLTELANEHGWNVETGGEFLLALKKDDATITLEPGGQIELSTPPCESIDCVRDSENKNLKELRLIGDKHGILWSGLGIHPVSDIDSIDWVPKERYQIMRRFFVSRGPLAHWMMKMTSSIQVTMDYRKADVAEKVQVAARLSPILTAMFANSCIVHSKPSGFKSYRSHIWQNTDPERCGLLPKTFDSDFTIRDYADYALDVPLFFIQRNGRLIDGLGMTFRQFMNRGWQNEKATPRDWELHLTCLFPEVRLRRYIEIRSVDSQSGELAFAVPVFLKSILYSPKSRKAMLRLLAPFDYSQARLALASAAKDALRGRYGSTGFLDLSRECLKIAQEGVSELITKGYFSAQDEKSMDSLKELILEDGLSPADKLIREYESGKKLIEIVRQSAL